jgi:hypothetical protein
VRYGIRSSIQLSSRSFSGFCGGSDTHLEVLDQQVVMMGEEGALADWGESYQQAVMMVEEW